MLPLEHSAILLTCIKLKLVLNAIFVFLIVVVLDRFYCNVLKLTFGRK